MDALQRILRSCLLILLLFVSLVGMSESRQTKPHSISIDRIAELQQSFQNPPDDSRIMMRWWWFGPAVSSTEIDRELRLMKESGIGGGEGQTGYPVMARDCLQ